MGFQLILKNYRCFPDSNPARIMLRPGFTSFVGVNNSGKSSLLRFFYEFRQLFQSLSSPSSQVIQGLTGTLTAFGRADSVFDLEEVFSNRNNRPIEIQLKFTVESPGVEKRGLPCPTAINITIPRGTNTWHATLDFPVPITIGGNNPSFTGTQLTLQKQPRADLTELFQAFKDLTEVVYIGSFRNAINIGTNENYFDIKVGQAFVKRWRGFKTGDLKKENEAAYKLTEDIKAIFGVTSLEISPSPDDTTLQVFVNGKSYKLHELGSGLTQFILTLANVAVRQPSYVLIDEPELNLHPSLQLDFLTTLTSYARKGVLFATHSIGLARSSADWIYSVRRIDEGVSELSDFEATSKLTEFLGELSFSGYRELGFNKILLVEGVTDVKTVQQFLRWYRKDHEIVILPLGGSQFINRKCEAQLDEIKRISRYVFALIDSERASANSPLNPDRQAFVDVCKKAEITCHVLDRRAIENYFTDQAIEVVNSDKYQSLEPYQALREAAHGWAKEQNWRIARQMEPQDLMKTDLGQFLSTL